MSIQSDQPTDQQLVAEEIAKRKITADLGYKANVWIKGIAKLSISIPGIQNRGPDGLVEIMLKLKRDGFLFVADCSGEIYNTVVLIDGEIGLLAETLAVGPRPQLVAAKPGLILPGASVPGRSN